MNKQEAPPATVEDFLELADSTGKWIVKRLSGNDTGATGGHGVGIYFPKWFATALEARLGNTEILNPDVSISRADFVGNGYRADGLRFIYYNNKFHPGQGTRNEYRVTRWGGSNCPAQDPENTGAIAFFLFQRLPEGIRLLVLVSENVDQDALIEQWLGQEVFPGEFYSNVTDRVVKEEVDATGKLPEAWLTEFPSGAQIFRWVERQLPFQNLESVDALLLKRRKLEFEVFRRIELAHTQPLISAGFETVDRFVELANKVTNRRKSRTGRSLELNLSSIFNAAGVEFSTQVVTENKKRPDFIFPSGAAYHDKYFPAASLHMLAAKTCCKDRWRQVVNEADRIETKHLFTLQEGVSQNQLREMRDEKVQLVIPRANIRSFPQQWRAELISLADFIAMRQCLTS